jgi:hypothetical protein
MGNQRLRWHVSNTVDLDWYLRRQAGVISCTQARAAGLSQDAVDRRIAGGRWDRLHPGLLRR